MTRGNRAARPGAGHPFGFGCSPDGGFTLIELVVALGLLAILLSSSLYAVMQGILLSRDNQNRVVAADVVTGVLEKLRTLSLTTAGFDSIPVTTQTLPSQVAAGATFHLTQTAEWVNRGVSGSACNSGTNASLVLRATVTASWRPSEWVTQSTLIAPPNGVLSSSNGALAVQVSSSSGSGFPRANVTVTNTYTTPNVNQTITTGSDGCAFFAELPPSTGVPPYAITVSSPGGVDVQEQSVFSTTHAVSAGTVSLLTGSNAINYDQGGTVVWSYSSSTPTPAAGMSISMDSSSQNLTDDLYAWTSGSVTPVYPGTYASIFAGSCTDADPAGLSKSLNPFYAGTPTPVTVTPGGSTSATVPVYPLNLEITNAAGLAITNAVSPSNSPPSAVAGATSLSGGGACPNGAPTYTLNPVSNNGVLSTSSTAVGLGHLAISVTVTVNGSNKSGSINVWVRPDGVYSVNSDGTQGSTEYYSFSGSGYVPIPVS
jgi:prepilin-type N-terminal cleavage/methylation domain-containing protein